MSRALTLLHLRGVEANRPTLSDGEAYIATDSKRLWHGSVPNKLPVIVASVDLATQGAAIASTTLFMPDVTGLYQINFYGKVTRAATTSSQLGAVTIKFSDGNDSTTQTLTMNGQSPTVPSTQITGNTTGAYLIASVTIYAVAGTAVQYAIAYSSTGTTSMQYSAHLCALLL